jgi:hypothetical protein
MLYEPETEVHRSIAQMIFVASEWVSQFVSNCACKVCGAFVITLLSRWILIGTTNVVIAASAVMSHRKVAGYAARQFRTKHNTLLDVLFKTSPVCDISRIILAFFDNFT